MRLCKAMLSCLYKDCHSAGSRAATHISAVLNGLLAVEGALLASEALHNESGVLINPDLCSCTHLP
jgi:hypothetical protein